MLIYRITFNMKYGEGSRERNHLYLDTELNE